MIKMFTVNSYAARARSALANLQRYIHKGKNYASGHANPQTVKNRLGFAAAAILKVADMTGERFADIAARCGLTDEQVGLLKAYDGRHAAALRRIGINAGTAEQSAERVAAVVAALDKLTPEELGQALTIWRYADIYLRNLADKSMNWKSFCRLFYPGQPPAYKELKNEP